MPHWGTKTVGHLSDQRWSLLTEALIEGVVWGGAAVFLGVLIAWFAVKRRWLASSAGWALGALAVVVVAPTVGLAATIVGGGLAAAQSLTESAAELELEQPVGAMLMMPMVATWLSNEDGPRQLERLQQAHLDQGNVAFLAQDPTRQGLIDDIGPDVIRGVLEEVRTTLLSAQLDLPRWAINLGVYRAADVLTADATVYPDLVGALQPTDGTLPLGMAERQVGTRFFEVHAQRLARGALTPYRTRAALGGLCIFLLTLGIGLGLTRWMEF